MLQHSSAAGTLTAYFHNASALIVLLLGRLALFVNDCLAACL